MTRHAGLTLCLWMSLAGCRSPVLWVGSARSEHAPLLTDAGSSKLEPEGSVTPLQPPAADPAPPAPHDAGTLAPAITASAAPPPPAAGAPAPPTARGAPPSAPAKEPDADAGTPAAPSAPVMPTRLPKVIGDCPDISGPGTYTFRAGNRSLTAQVHILAKAARNAGSPGPLILYFHALGTSSSEAVTALTQPTIDGVVNQGGAVVAFNSLPCLRCGVDDLVWYDEDDPVSDQAVACVRAQAAIDSRHIHVAGFSAGALHAMHLALVRSDYVASVLSYSGGMPTTMPAAQDPTNKVAALLSFGDSALDNAVADFNASSHAWYDAYHPLGYYVMLCNHGGGHEIPSAIAPLALRFFLDHPYRVSPEPYAAGVPSDYPKYCSNGP